jgi:murein DD-endopeptidase MepM/ murein hydrolase activator NlpD
MSLSGKIYILVIIFTLAYQANALEYEVAAGDSWQSIAKKYDLTPKILQKYNNTKTLGKTIIIPEKVTYIVGPGETALGVALKHGMSLSELVTINKLISPYEVNQGQKLKVIVKSNKAAPKESKPQEEKLKFRWPVLGAVTSSFGLQNNGANHDGIEILVNQDSDIVTSAKGEVVYIGNEVGSYGNLVIIQHSDNWFSSYGHLTKIIVEKGQIVKAGQIIGNNVKNSQLYFSIRKGQKPLNPLKLLPKQKK